MTLKEDVNAGLAKLSAPGSTEPFALDKKGVCAIPVPMPATVVEMADNRLMVRVELAPTESLFSLSTPLAIIKGTPKSEFFRTLLYRQRYADQVAGASLAVQAEDEEQEALIAIYHWLLGAITPDEFAALFKQFIMAAITLVEEISQMARREEAVKPVHKGRL